jgi:hypothetical protein
MKLGQVIEYHGYPLAGNDAVNEATKSRILQGIVPATVQTQDKIR